jgi:hypothetical protein
LKGYQTFIVSTYRYLSEKQTAVVGAMPVQEHIPIHKELFIAAEEYPLKYKAEG